MEQSMQIGVGILGFGTVGAGVARAIELEKKNRIKEELEQKIAEEEERIQLAEGKKQMLEQEEIEIMKKLKTTTQMHEQMVENYENLGKAQE